MNGAKATINYANTNEAMQALFKGTVGYTDSLWKTSLQGGYINDYILRLNTLASDVQLQRNLKELDFDLQEDEYKQLAIYNETDDAVKTNKVKQQVLDLDKAGKPVYARDNNGNVKRDKDGNPEYSYHTEEISEYEYNKNLLKQNAARINYENNLAQLQAIKDSRNWFDKAGMTILATLQESGLSLVEGTVQAIGDFYNIIEGIVKQGSGKYSFADYNGKPTLEGVEEAFSEREVDLYNIPGYAEWRKESSDWYAERTWLKEIDGQATFYGNLISSMGNSFGRMLPSMLIGNVAGMLGASKSVASWISTGTMYAGVAANNMYDLCNDELLSSSTAEKLLNATIKATTEMLIEKGLAKVLGATGIDALTQGFTQKVATKSGKIAAISRIAKDAMQEGLEEFLQEYSNYFIDRLFALNNEGYLYTTDWNFEVAATAFLSGALMSLGGSFLGVLKTKRVGKGEFKTDRDGNIKFDKKGNPKEKTFGKLASYEFNITLQEILERSGELLETAKGKDKAAIMEGIYPMVRMLSQYFSKMNTEVYDKSIELLNRINSKEADAITNTKQIASEFDALLKKLRLGQIRASIEDLKAAKLRGNSETYTREDIDGRETGDKVLNEIQQIFAKDASIEQVIVTEHGTAAVESEDGKTIIVPKRFANNADEAFKYIVETRLKHSVLKEKRFTKILEKLSSLYETRYNAKGDNTQVLFALLTNSDFRMDALCTNTADVLAFVSNLGSMLSTITDTQTASLAKQYAEAFQGTLVQYYSNTVYKDFEKLPDTALSAKNKEIIRRNQYPYDYNGEINKGLAKSKNRENIVNSLLIKIDAMTGLTAAEKDTLRKNIKSDDKAANIQAFSVIENYWYSTYNSEYNNKTYFEYAGQPQSMANSFLHHYGIDIPRVLLSAKAFSRYNTLFKEYTQGRYEFKLSEDTNRPVLIVESEARTEYTMRGSETWGVRNMNSANSYAYTIGTDNVLGNLVDADSDTKQFLTINDVIYDTSLLKESLRKQLEGKTPQQIVQYLTAYYLKESNGTKTIIQDNKGNYIVGDVSSMADMETEKASDRLHKAAKDISEGKEVKLKASSLFKTGNKDIDSATIVVRKGDGKADAGYNANTNTITLYIDEATLQAWLNVDVLYRVNHDKIDVDEATKLAVEDRINIFADNIKYLVWHEFRHAIQTNNRLSSGMTSDFLSNFNKTQQAKIVADMEEHVPELFKNSKNKTETANDLLYYSAGGEMQNADIEGVLENNFVPFVTDVENGLTVRTPWGSIYSIDSNGNTVVSTVTEIDRKAIKNIKKIEQQARVTFDSLYSENVKEALDKDTVVDNLVLSDTDWENIDKIYPWVHAQLGSFSSSNEKLRADIYKQLQDPAVRMASLKLLYLLMFNNKGMTFEQFMNSTMPYIRVQNSNKIFDNKTFVSATIKNEIVPALTDKINYIFIGNIKMSDVLGMGSSAEFEILIKPQELKKADVYRIDSDKIVSKNVRETTVEKYINEKVTEQAIKLRENFDVVPLKSDNALRGEYVFYNGKYSTTVDFENLKNIVTTIDGQSYVATDFNKYSALKEGNFVSVTVNAEGHCTVTLYNNSKDSTRSLIKTIKSLQSKGYNVSRYADVVYVGDESPFVKSTNTKLDAKNLQNSIDKAYTAATEASMYEYAQELSRTSDNVSKYLDAARRMKFEQLAKKDEKIVIDGKEYKYKELEPEKTLTKQEYAKKMQAKRRVKVKELSPNDVIRANTISYKFAQGTNLEKYVDTKTHKHPYMDYRLQNIIVATTGNESKLDFDFMQLVDNKVFAKEGVWTLLDYVRTHEDMNDATFKLINDNFFHNNNIKNVKQLNALVNNAGMAYALRGVLKYAASKDKYNTINVDEIFNRKMSIEEMQDYVNKMREFAPDLYKMYETAYNNFNRFVIPTEKGEIKQTKSSQTEHVNEGLLRVSLLENYDGSLFSYGSAAVWPNVLAYDSSLRRAGTKKQVSTEEGVKDTKGDNLTIGDTLASDFTVEDEAFSNKALTDIILDLVDYKIRQLIKKGSLKAEDLESNKAKQLQLVEKIKNVFEANPDKTVTFYKQLVASGKIRPDADFDLTDVNKVNTEVEADRSHLQRQIYNIATRTIINKMDVKSAKYRRFQETYEDLGFKKDGTWQMPKGDEGRALTRDEVVQLQNDIRAAREQLQAGVFDNKYTKADKERIKLLKEKIAKQQRQIKGQKETIYTLKGVKQNVNVDNETITLTADKPMPEQVKTLMDTTFNILSKTNVQNISEPDSVHTKKSYKTFIDSNPWLSNMDSATATTILEYLTTALPSFTSIEADTKWKMMVMYTYSYINSLVKTGAISIDYELVKDMQHQYEQLSSAGGQILNAVRITLSNMNPYSIALESAMKRSGVDLDKTDLEVITLAMNTYIDAPISEKENALALVQKLTAEAYDKALQRAKDSKAGNSVISKLIKFRTMAMLSSPGTWLRNITTNILVEKTSGAVSAIGNATWGALNKIADKIGGKLKKRKLAKMEKPVNTFDGDRDIATQVIRDTTGHGYKIITTENELSTAKEIQADLLKEYDYVQSRLTKSTTIDERLALRRDNLLLASRMIDADIKFYNVALEYKKAQTEVPLRRTLDGQYSIVDTLKGSKYKFKENKDGTYSIEGVVVNKEVTNFILNEIFNSGLFDQIKDGISKYDTFDSSSSIAGNVTAMIVKSISSKLFYNNQFNSKTMNWLAKGLYKMLSDEKWVNRAFVKYLAATLTEDKVNLNNGVTKDVMSYIADAFVLASADYMHKSSFIGDIELKFRERFGEKAYAMWKFVFPFANASWNWFTEGLKWTPFGLAKSIYDFARFENTVDSYDRNYRNGKGVNSRFAAYIVKKNIGKGIVGSIGFVVGMIATALGVCGVEEDKKDKKTKIRIGDVYIDFSDVFGTTGIGMGVILGDAFADKERFFDAMVDTLDYMFDDSIFSDVYDMVQYKQSFAEVLLDPYNSNNILASFVPNLLKTITSSTYIHEVKYSKGFIGTLERIGVSVLPGLAYGMPKQYDPFTGELQYKYTPDFWGVASNILNRFSSLKVYPRNISALEKETLSLGLSKGNLTGKYEDIGQLSPTDVSTLNEIYGELNNKLLLELMRNKTKYTVEDKNGKRVELFYRQMTKEQRKSVVNRIMTNNAKIAKIYVWTSNGHKYYTTENFRNTLIKNGILSGVYLEQGKKKGFVD